MYTPRIKDAHLVGYYTYRRLSRLAPFTYLRIRLEISLFFRYLNEKGVRSIKECNEKVIIKYLSYNRKTKFWLTGRKRSFHTIAYKRTILWNYFEYLYQMGYIPNNPITNIPRPLLPRRIPRFLTFKQARRLLKYSIKNKRTPHQFQIRDRAYISLILFYGLVNHEIFRIKKSDIDYKKKTIRIRMSRFHDQRILPLLRPAEKWIKEYLKVRPRRKSLILFQKHKVFGDYGFNSSRGALNRLSRKLKYNVSSSTLRNTFYSLVFNVGVEHRVIQAITGVHTLKTITRRSSIAFGNKRKTLDKYMAKIS
ncbi:MAG: tyrosine-type recombinase/integrase [Candidatus Margulisiibacteriota bacterium]